MQESYLRENVLQDIKGYLTKTKDVITSTKDELQFKLLRKAIQTGVSPQFKKLNSILIASYTDIKNKYPIAFKIVLSILSKKIKRTPEEIDSIMQNESDKSILEKINIMTQFFHILFPSNKP